MRAIGETKVVNRMAQELILVELQCRQWKWNVSYQYEQTDCGREGMMLSNLMPCVKRQRTYEVCQGGCYGQWCQRQSSCQVIGLQEVWSCLDQWN